MNRYFWLAVALLLFPGCGRDHAAPTSPQTSNSPADKASLIVDWLQDRRITKSGAIWTDHDHVVDPWFGNVTAIGLLEEGSERSRSLTRGWLSWCLSHTTVNGELPNYQIIAMGQPGETERVGERKTQDNRMGSTLSLARVYLNKTNDRQFFERSNRLTILSRIASRLDGLIGSSGLTTTYPTGNVEYLQDNISVYAGLRDYSQLLSQLGKPDGPYYLNRAETVRNAIEQLLFNGESYVPATGEGVDLRRFYPDGVNQVYGLTYWRLPEQEQRATRLWQKFLQFQKHWTIMDKCDDVDEPGKQFPWVKVANAALSVGDQATAIVFESNIREAFDARQTDDWVRAGTGVGWTTAEAGDYLVYLSRVGTFVLVDSDIAASSNDVVIGTSEGPDGSKVVVQGSWSVRPVAIVNESCHSDGYYRPHTGRSYLHDHNSHDPDAPKSVRFIPYVRRAGYYDVRLVYADDPNRQHAVLVTVHDDRGGEITQIVDQGIPMEEVNSQPLGVFHFGDKSTEGWVEVSNAVPSGVEPGTVVADAVIFIAR